MIRFMVFLLLLINMQLTDSTWLKLALLAGMLFIYIKEIVMLLGWAASSIFSLVGKILGVGIVIGIFVTIPLPLVAIMKYGGSLFGLNVSWSSAYATSIIIILIGSLVWFVRRSIIRQKKIQSLFPLEQSPSTEDISWILSDLKSRKHKLEAEVQFNYTRGDRYEHENQTLMDTLRFLDKTIDKLTYDDPDEELLNTLNEIFQHDKEYDTRYV